MLRAPVDHIDKSDRLLMPLCYVSIGLLVLSCFYLLVLRHFIVDMERLGFSPRPRSYEIWACIVLISLLTLGAVMLIRRFRYNRTLLRITAYFILLFHATLYCLMTLYLLFYRAPDIHSFQILRHKKLKTDKLGEWLVLLETTVSDL